MKFVKYPLIPCVLFIALGIIMGSILKVELMQILCVFIIFFIVFAFLKEKTKITSRPFFFGLFTYIIAIQIGILLSFLHYSPNQKNHYSKAIKNEFVLLNGTIKGNLKPSKDKDKYLIQLNQLNNKSVTGNLLLYFPKEDKTKLIPGSEIIIRSKLFPIKKSTNPFQFDYGKYMEKQNIFHQVYGDKTNLKIINQTKSLNYYLHSFRLLLNKKIDKHDFNSKTKALLNTLLLGQRILLDKETINDYTNAGVIHILAISGLHIGIIYLLLNFVLQRLEKKPKTKIIKLLLILLFLWGFALVSGLSASVTRAVLMFSIISIGKHFNKDNNTLNAIATSAFILLCYNANNIFDVGFQMSYAAVISIVLFNPYFKYFYFTKNKIIKYSTDIILVSLAAQIGVLPLSLFYFNQFPALFLVANIIVIPLTTAILFTGIATLIITSISTSFGLLIGKILSFFIETMNSYIHWIANFEQFLYKNISFSYTLCILAYFAIGSFIFFLYNTRIKNLKLLFFSIILFQFGYSYIKYSENNLNELTVFSTKKSLITIKNNKSITAFTSSPEDNIENIKNYKRGTFSENFTITPLENTLYFKENKILIIDSLCAYNQSIKPDIIILTQGTRVNLERVIKINTPKLIIADNSNSKYKVERWEKTCVKEKIPFHSTYEKGLYKIVK